MSNQSKSGRKTFHPYKLWIPENLNIEELLNSYPPEFKYYKDCFIYILHLIVSIPVGLKDYDIEKHKGFTPINKVILSRRIHNYKRYIEYLIRHGIIEEGTSYMPGHYSMGLKFRPQYVTKVRGIYIRKNTLIKSIIEKPEHRDMEAEKELAFLKKWINSKLTIDIEMAKEFLESDKETTRRKHVEKRAHQRTNKSWVSIDEIVIMTYNMRFIVADKINEGKYHHPTVDRTSGRFHSPLTQLKKELRRYVRYNGEKLYCIDIVNSQPLLAMIVLDFKLFMGNEIYKVLAHYNTTHSELKHLPRISKPINSSSTMFVNLIKKCYHLPDVKRYKKAVIEGRFYEVFGDLLVQKSLVPPQIIDHPEDIRKFAKTAVFTAFFSKNKDAKWNDFVKAFRKCFPNVCRIFTLIKAGNNNHSALACLLQRFESNLVLHDTCTLLNKYFPDAPLFTVHDSIVTTEKYVGVFRDLFKEQLVGKLDAIPILKIEEW
jgi:hypothetical protein